MLGNIRNFIQDESGQGIIEYAGVLAFAAGLIVLLGTQQTAINTSIKSVFSTIQTNLTSLSS